jgi:hypothetical protein
MPKYQSLPMLATATAGCSALNVNRRRNLRPSSDSHTLLTTCPDDESSWPATTATLPSCFVMQNG